jgi:hypothetical protein
MEAGAGVWEQKSVCLDRAETPAKSATEIRVANCEGVVILSSVLAGMREALVLLVTRKETPDA